MATRTKAQQEEEARRVRQIKSVRRWAWSALIGMLLVSIVVNGASVWSDPIDYWLVGLAVLAPIGLFISSALFERMVGKDVFASVLLLTVAVVSLVVSWYHFTVLGLNHGAPVLIALLTPFFADIPMLLAGRLIMTHPKPIEVPKSVSSRQTTAPRTTRTNPTKATTPRKRVPAKAPELVTS